MKSEPAAVLERRERTRVRASVKQAHAALDLARAAARRGDLNVADRALKIAERQAKVARQLFDLDGELKRIWQARRKAETMLEEYAADLEARTKAARAAEPPKIRPDVQIPQKYFGPIDR